MSIFGKNNSKHSRKGPHNTEVPRARKLLGVVRRCLRYTVSEAHDRLYEVFRDRNSSLRGTEEMLGRKTGAAPTVMSEVYAKLYDRTIEDAPVTAGAEPVEQVFEALESDPRFGRLQRMCRNNPGLAARVASSLVRPIARAMPEPEQPEPQDHEGDTLPRRPGQGVDGSDMDEGGVCYPGAPDPSTEDLPEDNRKWVAQSAVDAALEAAQEDAEMVTDVAQAFGLGNPESREEHEDLHALLEAIDAQPGLAEIMKLAGRLGPVAEDKARYNLLKNRGERVDVELGDNVSQALLHEIGQLASSRTRPDALRKVAESSMSQWEREEREPLGAGPVVFCIDRSGSMYDEPLTWAKALFLALARYAAVQNRALEVIWFSNGVTRVTRYEPGTTPVKLLQELRVTANGGTNFEKPLRRAVDSIRNSAQFKNADIVFLTDGAAANPGPWFKDACDELDINTLGIVLEMEVPLPFCDGTVMIPELTIEAATTVLNQLK